MTRAAVIALLAACTAKPVAQPIPPTPPDACVMPDCPFTEDGWPIGVPPEEYRIPRCEIGMCHYWRSETCCWWPDAGVGTP
jgi:hypothetical protein